MKKQYIKFILNKLKHKNKSIELFIRAYGKLEYKSVQELKTLLAYIDYMYKQHASFDTLDTIGKYKEVIRMDEYDITLEQAIRLHELIELEFRNELTATDEIELEDLRQAVIKQRASFDRVVTIVRV